MPGAHAGPGIVMVPGKQNENLIIHGELSIQEIMPQWWGSISCKASTGLVLPNLNSNAPMDQTVSRRYNHTPEQNSKRYIEMPINSASNKINSNVWHSV